MKDRRGLLVLIIVCLLNQAHAQLSRESRQYFIYANQFLLGFRAQQYVPNIYDCANALEYAASEVNRTA
jgi:hypothetical protein